MYLKRQGKNRDLQSVLESFLPVPWTPAAVAGVGLSVLPQGSSLAGNHEVTPELTNHDCVFFFLLGTAVLHFPYCFSAARKEDFSFQINCFPSYLLILFSAAETSTLWPGSLQHVLAILGPQPWTPLGWKGPCWSPVQPPVLNSDWAA